VNNEDAAYLPGGSKYAEKTDRPGDATLNKVRALLASAEDAAFPPEVQEQYRNRAEALMFQYKISMLDLQGTPQAVTFEPQWRNLFVCDITNEFRMEYLAIFSAVMSHCSVRGGWSSQYSTELNQGRGYYMNVVGFVPDLQYMELLLTNALLTFGAKLEPKKNPGLSMEENVYAMRAAGMERGRIARIMWPEKFVGQPSGHVDKGANKRVTAIFTRESEKRGESTEGLLGQGVSMRNYRHSYAEGFVDELWSRLLRMKQVRGGEAHAVQLANVQQRVDEALYQRYPNMRPSKVPSGNHKAPNEDCPRCQQAKSGYCREHMYLKPSAAKAKDVPYSQAGIKRGRDAARSVDLGGTNAGAHAVGSTRREVEGK
jgi:hypothetical protein